MDTWLKFSRLALNSKLKEISRRTIMELKKIFNPDLEKNIGDEDDNIELYPAKLGKFGNFYNFLLFL